VATACIAPQEATDIYKGLLLDHRELLALNMYVALCYAKLDYYDVSQEILQVGGMCYVTCYIAHAVTTV
jgi:hypothetical protein